MINKEKAIPSGHYQSTLFFYYTLNIHTLNDKINYIQLLQYCTFKSGKYKLHHLITGFRARQIKNIINYVCSSITAFVYSDDLYNENYKIFWAKGSFCWLLQELKSHSQFLNNSSEYVFILNGNVKLLTTELNYFSTNVYII